MKSNKIYIWLPLVIALSIAGGIIIGNFYSKLGSGNGGFGQGNSKLSEIFSYINKAYVDTVNVDELIDNAIPGLISGLDPHSSYISVEDMQLSGDQLEGHFSGIGVEFMLQHDTVIIINALSGGASEAVGIMPGDKIVTVNDSVFAGNKLTNEKVLRTLKGEKGTKVKIGVKRETSPDVLDFTVTRADVPVKSVDIAFEIDDEIGYIKVNKFGSQTYSEFISGIAKLKAKGCTSFIVDLQQNSGGYMGAAIMMTNEFLSEGQLIVFTEGRATPRENVFSDNSGSCKTDQLVVLIDEGSASASEIFAGAIQDNDRGLIVGRRSFGKGLVQQEKKFKDGSALRLTIARYHTPSGRCIQKSYEKGKGDEYGQDLWNRYQRGEFDNRDSIKLDNLPLFHTQAGRPVYGNDGILADVFVPRDTVGVNSYYLKVANKGLIREYAFLYADKHREALKKFKTWEAAYEHLTKQPLVENLVSLAEGRGIRRRPYLVEEARLLMKTQLESLIIRHIYGDDGFYPIYMKDDTVLKTAIEMIKANRATPQSVAREEYKKVESKGSTAFHDKTINGLNIDLGRLLVGVRLYAYS